MPQFVPDVGGDLFSVEGMSMRAVTRVTGVSINTVAKLLDDASLAAATVAKFVAPD